MTSKWESPQRHCIYYVSLMSINFYKQKDLHWVLEVFLQFSLIQRYEETLYTVDLNCDFTVICQELFFLKKLKKHKKSDKLLDKFKPIGYIGSMRLRKNKEEIKMRKTMINTRKENADFLIESIHGDVIIKVQNNAVLNKKFRIKETYDNSCIRITRNTLEKLQSIFTWEPNF